MGRKDSADRVDNIVKAVHHLESLRADLAKLAAAVADAEKAVLGMTGPAAPTRQPVARPRMNKQRSTPKSERAATIQDQIIAALRLNAEADTAVLGTNLYGDATPETRHKVRSLLFALKKKGRVVRRGDRWEVVDTK